MSRYCNMCGDCCKGFNKDAGVIVFPSEALFIATNMKISLVSFLDKYCNSERLETAVGEIKLQYLKDKDGSCCFLKENKCSIQNIKPFQCTRWPSIDLVSTIWNKPCFSTSSSSCDTFEDDYPNELLDELF